MRKVLSRAYTRRHPTNSITLARTCLGAPPRAQEAMEARQKQARSPLLCVCSPVLILGVPECA